MCPLKVLSAAASKRKGEKGHPHHSTRGSLCYLSLSEVPVQHG